MKRIRSFVLLLTIVLIFSGGALAAELSPEKLYERANQQFWDGEYQRAESTFGTLLETFPDSELYWDARYGMGRTLYKQGRMDESVSHFQAVRRNHTESSVRGDALFSLAEVAILRNRTIRARELLRTFLDLFPDHVLEPTVRKQLNLLGDPSETPPTTATKTSKAKDKAGKKQPRNPRPRLKSRSTGETEARQVLDPMSKNDTSPESPSADTQPSIHEDTDTEPTETKSTSKRSKRISPIDEPGADTGPTGESTSDTPKRTMDTTADTPADKSVSSGTSGAKLRNDSTDTNRTPDEVDSMSPDTNGASESDTQLREEDAPATEPRQGKDQYTESLERRAMDRIRTFYQDGKMARAREEFETDFLNEQSTPEDYYLAARLMDTDGNRDRSLKYINEAIDSHDNPPSQYHLLKAELLVSEGEPKVARSSLDSVDPEQFGDEEANDRARYYYLRGTISLELENDDEAFFHFMDAVRSAPSSRWAKEARETIENRL